MKQLLTTLMLLTAYSAFSQGAEKKNPSIYDQLDRNQPKAKTAEVYKPVIVNYDKEIARLQKMLDAENAKPNPEPSHVYKLTYHIQRLKIEKQNDPNKLVNLSSK